VPKDSLSGDNCPSPPKAPAGAEGPAKRSGISRPAGASG
jgi:hypothetical protein